MNKFSLELLGERIRTLRMKLNISQSELALRADIFDNMSKIEAGVVNIKVTTLIKIANGLDVKIEDLFKFLEDTYYE